MRLALEIGGVRWSKLWNSEVSWYKQTEIREFRWSDLWNLKLDELGEVSICPILMTFDQYAKGPIWEFNLFFLVSVESGRVVEAKWSRVLTSSRSTHAFCCCCWCCFLLHVSRDHDRRSSKLGAAATHFGKSRNFSLSNHSVTKSHENSFSDTYPGASSSLNLR